MTQERVSKENAKASRKALDEIMKAFPKSKILDFIGHFNEVFLFIEACERVLPSEVEEKK